MKKLAVISVFCLALLGGERAEACSMFNVTYGDETWIGRNMDYFEGTTGHIWYLPQEENLNGAILFGANADIWPQGGMNDKGLVLGMASTPEFDIPADPQKELVTLDFWEDMFSTCDTVVDAVNYVQAHDLSGMDGYFTLGHFMLTDPSGDSVVIEGNQVIDKTGDYHIMTNYLLTDPTAGYYPCERYEIIETALDSPGQLTEAEFKDLIWEVSGENRGFHTPWAQFYKPGELEVTVFYKGDFDHWITFDLMADLQGGAEDAEMDDLFADIDEDGGVEEDAGPSDGTDAGQETDAATDTGDDKNCSCCAVGASAEGTALFDLIRTLF